MKVLLLGQYPPFASLTATQGYWLAQYLQTHGADVNVVSDGWHVESNFRCRVEADDFSYLNSSNPRFFSIDPLHAGSYGTDSEPHQPRLVSLALDVYERYGFDLIYTNLLPTYSSAAFTLKQITGKPLVVTHHQDNFEQIFFDSYLETFTNHILKNADLVLSYPKQNSFFNLIGVKTQEMIPLGVVDESTYTDLVTAIPGRDQNLPTILITGNVDYSTYINFAVNILCEIPCKFNLLLSCGGKNVSLFKQMLANSKLADQVLDLGVLAPWRQPGLYKNVDLIIPGNLLSLNSTFDPGVIFQLMSLGKACVLSPDQLNISSYLKLDASNTLIIDGDFGDAVKSFLDNPEMITACGRQAKTDYAKVDQRKLIDLLKGVL